MKIIIHNRIGNPAEVLSVEDQASRVPAAGEVRVRLLAAPIHPSDLLKISGLYGIKPQLPETPGSEGVGEIVEVGAGVTHLAVGDRVLLLGLGGTWRSEFTVPAASLMVVPKTADADQLAMVAINPLTAWLLLQDFVALQPGDVVVQSAANSAVGEYLVQIAKTRAIRTVNIVRRADSIDGLKALGADHVLLDGPDLGRRIREAAAGQPIRLAVDAVAGETMGEMLNALDQGGTLVSYGAMSGRPGLVAPTATIFRDVSLRGFWLARWFQTASPEARRAAFSALVPMVAAGAIKASIDSRFPLDHIAAAVTRAAEGGRSGKVLLTAG